ncbi:PAS domain-containing protein [Rubellimicrobium aerolatum]|uniref:histidine kinase n=1 Tax=Rubellimicrobium aerolatum TaxID=490979 RepID=A0ABW0SGU0_9RHOB|nr:PAS domain-containing protein [Rubellimicrobium aerolatum]MBP1807609.1 PAS domain S-box-containing protein [Rubellimicrobium aerolatum]
MKRTTVSERALVLAPRGRDATIASMILREAGIAADACATLPDLLREMDKGTGFVLVTEETLVTADLAPLSDWLADQPEWSDLPFILLTSQGGGVERNPAARRFLEVLGNVTFLERPFHPTTLVSLARSALRGRRRQYEARARLEALRDGEAALRALNADLERQVTERALARGRTWALSPEIMGVLNAEGIFEQSNPAWQAVLGWSEPEVASRVFFDFIHPDDLSKTRAAWTAAVERGEPALRFENRYRHKDGGWRWLSWIAVPDDGKVYCTAREVTAEKGQAEALAERTAELVLYRNVVESDRFPICAYDADMRVTTFNTAHADDFLRVMGRPAALGEVLPDLFPPEQAAVLQAFIERALGGETFTVEADFGDPDMTVPHWELDFAPVRDEAGRIVGAFHHARDVSDRLRATAELRALEEQLRQSQKMEAVGQLTGGLAHDFNNLLAGIQGSLEMIGTRTRQGRMADVDRYLVAAQEAARRAAALTHRLLAFSRRQTLAPRATDVDALVAGMEELLRRTVGPGIEMEVARGPDVWAVEVDPNQLENALLNLVINARDAMPDGGRITIETANRALDKRAARERDIAPGHYVSLSVTDTGTGMPPEVAARAFDPFFTTKPLGVGTGLGLSMVYGFARQSGGQVRIHSAVGQGTTVSLYLPRHTGGAEGHEVAPLDAPGEAVPAAHGETVLVIDDEALVRMLVVDALTDLGFATLEAANGPEGLAVLRSPARIDLLVTDVGLPGGLNGRQVADAARTLRPGLPVLFVTGYAETAVLSHGHLDPGMEVMTKPFGVQEIGRRVRAILSKQ